MAKDCSSFNIALFYIAARNLQCKTAGLSAPNLQSHGMIIGELIGHPGEEVFVRL